MAHVRLLLRVAKAQLRDNWAWGPEAKADLVLVDTRKLVGDSAMRRATQRGVASAQVIAANAAKPPGLSLRRPLQRDALVMLLNNVGREEDVADDADSWTDAYQGFDMGAVDLSFLEADHPGVYDVGAHRNDGSRAGAEFEPTPSGEPRPDLSSLLIGANSAVEPTPVRPGESGAPGASGVEPGAEHLRQVRAQAAPDRSPAPEIWPDIDSNAAYPLTDYLGTGLLGGSARISLRGATTLLLDPRQQLFWASGLLPTLEIYARQPLRFGDFERLTGKALEDARRGSAARPYARLLWMDHYVRSNGFLAKQLDPSGTFVLTNRLDFSLDYPRAYRIGSLLNVPRKLHEVSRISSVALDEVFDIINAYAALGYVECTPH